MNCEDCKYYHTFETFYDSWNGMQYDNECTCPLDEMTKECAKELGLDDNK